MQFPGVHRDQNNGEVLTQHVMSSLTDGRHTFCSNIGELFLVNRKKWSTARTTNFQINDKNVNKYPSGIKGQQQSNKDNQGDKSGGRIAHQSWQQQQQ